MGRLEGARRIVFQTRGSFREDKKRAGELQMPFYAALLARVLGWWSLTCKSRADHLLMHL